MKNNNVKCLIFNDELNSKFKIQNSKLIRNGFSMVELIFVILLIGILAYIGGNFLPDNRLLNDTNFLTMKIKQTQKNALLYDAVGFLKPWSVENNSTCIDLNTTKLELKDKNTQKPHRFSSILSVDGNSTICFDNFGRPYQSEHLLLKNLDMNLTYKQNEYKSISVVPISGYAIIKK
ncbi:MAG: prepilin-type N-terminal cleavage/methylation domain-containing protein [Sulfurospirillum sp.]